MLHARCTPLYICISVKGSLCRCSHQSLYPMIIKRTTVRAFGYLALSCFQAKYPNPNRNSFWQAAVSWEFFQILRVLIHNYKKQISMKTGIITGNTKVPRETHDTPINPRMTPAFSDSNFIYVFVIACHYSSNNQSLKILPWA